MSVLKPLARGFLALAICSSAAILPGNAGHGDRKCKNDNGDISFEHCRSGTQRGKGADGAGTPAGHCYLKKAYVDPGQRRRRGNIFPRVQDAIDAVRPGGTVVIRRRTGTANPSGGLRGDRGHVFLESLDIDKPINIVGGENERGSWGQLSSGPDGRCLTVHLKPRSGRCWFRMDKAQVRIRNLSWAEVSGREPSQTPCIHVQNGTLHMANTDITWASDRAAIRVARGGTAQLRDVTVSVNELTGRAISLYDGRLHISGGSFVGNQNGAVILLSGGQWTIDGTSISGGQYGLAVTLDAASQGRLTRSSLSGNLTGLSMAGTGDGRSVSARIEITDGNEFSDNAIGALFQDVARVNFSGNRLVRNTETGLAIERSSGTFRNNVFLNNDVSIQIGEGPKWTPAGSPAHPEISNNQIRGETRRAIQVMPGGMATVSGNTIRVRKCHCVWGDIDSANLLFGRSDCPRADWSRSCRKYRERRERELQEAMEGGTVVIE